MSCSCLDDMHIPVMFGFEILTLNILDLQVEGILVILIVTAKVGYGTVPCNTR